MAPTSHPNDRPKDKGNTPARSTANDRIKGKQKTAYKHNSYVCPKCRAAHRRCKHDPSADPNYNPAQPRRHLRPSMDGGEQTTPGSATAETPRSVSETASSSMQMDVKLPSPISQVVLDDMSLVVYEQLWMTLIDDFCMVPLPAHFWRLEWAYMLQVSPTLQAVTRSITLFHAQDWLDQLEAALSYKRAANLLQHTEPRVKGTEYYRRGTPLLIDAILAFCDFASQGPFDEFCTHAPRSHPLIIDYILNPPQPTIMQGVFMAREPDGASRITQRLVARCPDVAQAFFQVFPQVDFYKDWATGRIQDLAFLMLTCFTYMCMPPNSHGSLVRRLFYRLYTFQVAYKACEPAHQSVVDLVAESVYVALLKLEYPDRLLGESHQASLAHRLAQVEHQYGIMPFTRSVLELVCC